ncbi:MAG TPA: phosphoribosylglycinamide formyltransferase [Chitinophagaceae bacterium]|nr:phosphoribosylglycinamide formyltransferase [Chitinophagaceae bacterium]
MKKVAIFASGAGTNAENIIRSERSYEIALIACNNPGAGVLEVAARHSIPAFLLQKEKFLRDGYVEEFKRMQVDFIVLAGFLWKLPSALLEAYPRRIVNIHPALLPEFGGKGMYGNRVHEAVLHSGSKETGITIHYVDEHYDHGDTILQVPCPVRDDDSPQTLAQRVHALEYAHYPKVIESLVSKLPSN